MAVALRIQTKDTDRSAVRKPQSGHALHGRRLARAVGPQEAEDLALVDREGNILDCDRPAVRLVKTGNLDDGMGAVRDRTGQHSGTGDAPMINGVSRGAQHRDS
jgi:hypothetical protein